MLGVIEVTSIVGLALGETAGRMLKKAAERHVETFFGDRIKGLAKPRKKTARSKRWKRRGTSALD